SLPLSSTLTLHDALPILHQAANAPTTVARVSSLDTVQPSSTQCWWRRLYQSRSAPPIGARRSPPQGSHRAPVLRPAVGRVEVTRSEEHTSELQSRENLVC